MSNLPDWLRDLLSSFGLLHPPHRETSVAHRRYNEGEDGPDTPGSRIGTYEAQPDDDVIGAGEERPLVKVKSVDLQVAQNTTTHNTDKYEATQDDIDGKPNTPQLIVRRGQAFEVVINMTQNMIDSMDKITIVFDMGANPRVSKDTRVQIPVKNKGVEEDTWGAKATEYDGNGVRVRIFTPPSAYVGKLKMHVDTSRPTRGHQLPETIRYTHPDPLVLLFNPWCQEDSVYLKDDLGLKEYVLNDIGKIYSGNYRQMRAKPWNFGQFEQVVLDCALYLLEKSKLQIRQRGNPVYIARKISALVNSQDDNGVLVGNWSGNYNGGARPTSWVGSVAILEQYWESKTPVCFGQCWVFSGLVTSVCRALGLPCRSVTNFASAHDTDGSITIDKHYDTRGEPLDTYNSDSIWNFHVWNDVWMARPDLPAGYGGWQAIDATPQELSDGEFRAGPASLVGIKQGEVSMPYDAPFIFAEVNADVVYWEVDSHDNFKKLRVKTLSVGRNMSTKKPTGRAPTTRLGPFSYFNDDPDRLDVTSQYKHREKSEEERTAVMHACSQAALNRDVYTTAEEDVEFELPHEDGVFVGQPFTVICRMRNLQKKEKEVRNIHVIMTAYVVSYNGVRVAQIKKKKDTYEIKAQEEFEAKMAISPDDYLEALVEQGLLQVSVLCRVAETGQVFADDDDFRLVHPDIDIKVPDTVEINSPFKATLEVKNPLPRMLTRCEFNVEAPGLQKPLLIPLPNIAAGGEAKKTITLTPRKEGERQLIVSFDSKQLTEVTGYASLQVLPKKKEKVEETE